MDLQEMLVKGHAVNGLVIHIVFCYRNTLRPDYENTNQKQSVELIKEFTEHYNAVIPIPEGYGVRPGMTSARLLNTITQRGLKMSPACAEAASAAMEQINNAARYGDYLPGKNAFFSQAGWLRRRSDAAMKEGGDFI